ncbi:MAG TPA: trehalose-phosphatase [Bryobacteraceae bacterium]|nr:trehalose-phosphatase [Bryobacteraceae bacterium]
MRDAVEHFSEISPLLRDQRHTYLFLDFDGTLAPIVPRPEEAKMPEGTHGLIHELSKLPCVDTAIVSGRSLADLKSRVNLDLILAGNHGLEIEGPGFQFQEPQSAALADRLSRLSETLDRQLRRIPGAFVENKVLSASAHFRRVAPDQHEAVREIVEDVYQQHGAGFRLRPGKMIIEIRPDVDWHKGAATKWLLHQAGNNRFAIAFGDDDTDEDMFRAVSPDGLSVRVGYHESSTAQYFVDSTEQAHALLERLYAELSQVCGRDQTQR